jgi:tRNA A58 N-methylase Trm61
VQGSGYLTACFALLVQPSGFAVGIERNTSLVAASLESLRRSLPELMDGSAIAIRPGNILGGIFFIIPFLIQHLLCGALPALLQLS